MDEFSDDGLDDLNDTVLQELENKALQLTQAPPTQAQKPARLQAASPQYIFDDDDDDLDDAVVIDEHAQPPRRPPQPPQALSLSLQQPRAPLGTVPGGATQRWNQHLPPSRPAYPPRPQYPPSGPVVRPLPSQCYPPAPSQRHPALSTARPTPRAQPPPGQSQFARPPPPIPRPYVAPPSQALHGAGPTNQNDVVAALQARLAELESDLTAAKGEAAILRSKYDKARATHEADVTRLKKEAVEQLAKQERIAEQARAAERTTATELQFARQDLREGLGRAKAKRKDGPGTPKKDWTWGMADGFDGVEILSSPTKGQALRRKDSGPAGLSPAERTPTKGKRKRPTVDSPTFALETDGGGTEFGDTRAPGVSPLPGLSAPGSLSLDYLRLFLDHAASREHLPTFDVFSHFAFPSEPKQSLASILLQRLPQMGSPGAPMSLLVDLADLLIELWHRCLSERYYEPTYYLAGLLSYTLELNAVAVAPHILSSLIPVAATTCRLVALPRLHSPDGELAGHPDAVTRQLCANIDVFQCLSLLFLAALGCLFQAAGKAEASDPAKPSPQIEFWRTMELDFVLTMLSPKHPEADWLAMMSLLRTSAAPSSIGPIPSPATDPSGGRAEARRPAVVAATVIDCVSSFLRESPRWALPGSEKEIAVRSAALETLAVFATSAYGALQIAESDVAIPRLVTVLCWAIDRLYDADMPTRSASHESATESMTERGDEMELDMRGSDAVSDMQVDEVDKGYVGGEELDLGPDPATVLCGIISRATALLHFLVTGPGTSDVANMSAKLAASHGGSQRYALTLARLTFVEDGLVLEAGIDAETVELAHELLELAVTPDEGDEISELFD